MSSTFNRSSEHNSTQHDLQKQIDTINESLQQISNAMLQDQGSYQPQWSERAKQAANHVAAKSHEAAAVIGEQAHTLDDAVVNQLRSKPYLSLGIAAGVGFVLAQLSRK
ncbi:DUF883 family protein [Pseudovibrio exalbescens]|uniref:DUF883 family protein n=1 Tax=Pseudovibrio exalbescens TaxID=197461 RepID=UPI000C9B0204|nr:hypothetical protein [Pseudovibrio exalbescens]